MSAALALSLIPAILLIGLVGGLLLPVNLQMTVTDTALVIEPRGLDVLWTMRRRIEVPIATVIEVRVVRREQAPKRGLRLPGAYIPGVITAGSYGVGAERAFWDVRHAEEVLLIRCRVGSPYSSIVLEFPDPYAVLARTRTVVSHTV